MGRPVTDGSVLIADAYSEHGELAESMLLSDLTARSAIPAKTREHFDQRKSGTVVMVRAILSDRDPGLSGRSRPRRLLPRRGIPSYPSLAVFAVGCSVMGRIS